MPPLPRATARKRLRRIALLFLLFRNFNVFVDYHPAFRTVEQKEPEGLPPCPN